VVQVVVTTPSRSITLQNNISTSLNIHEIVQVKVAQTESGVYTRNDLLTDDPAQCLSLPGDSIPSGSSRKFNITVGNNYSMFIGIGIWDMDNFFYPFYSPLVQKKVFHRTRYLPNILFLGCCQCNWTREW
jgi:hypothetical protein